MLKKKIPEEFHTFGIFLAITAHTAPKYLENIVKIFLGNIMIAKIFRNLSLILLKYFPNIAKTSKCINNSF